MLKIEPLGSNAIERARAVRLRALKDAPDEFWVTFEEEASTTEEEWRRRLTGPDEQWFVANLDGEDVGLVVGSRHYKLSKDAALTAMWVAPSARGQGIASALIQRVIEWARSEGYGAIRLDVTDNNETAIRVYEREGFMPSGSTEVLPPPRDHISEHERILELAKSDS